MVLSSFKNNPIRVVVVFAVLVFVSLLVFLTVQYIQSRRVVVVTFSNVKEVRLVEFRTLKSVEVLKKSGDKINIDKSTRYKLVFIGNNGYSSGDIPIEDDKKIDINPYYSEEKLRSMLTDTVVSSIHDKMKAEYTNVLDEYTIERGKLHHFGEWYSTNLVYKQGYGNMSDTLHVIAKKTSSGWGIVADPNITFDKFSYPKIPIDILRDVNS